MLKFVGQKRMPDRGLLSAEDDESLFPTMPASGVQSDLLEFPRDDDTHMFDTNFDDNESVEEGEEYSAEGDQQDERDEYEYEGEQENVAMTGSSRSSDLTPTPHEPGLLVDFKSSVTPPAYGMPSTSSSPPRVSGVLLVDFKANSTANTGSGVHGTKHRAGNTKKGHSKMEGNSGRESGVLLVDFKRDVAPITPKQEPGVTKETTGSKEPCMLVNLKSNPDPVVGGISASEHVGTKPKRNIMGLLKVKMKSSGGGEPPGVSRCGEITVDKSKIPTAMKSRDVAMSEHGTQSSGGVRKSVVSKVGRSLKNRLVHTAHQIKAGAHQGGEWEDVASVYTRNTVGTAAMTEVGDDVSEQVLEEEEGHDVSETVDVVRAASQGRRSHRRGLAKRTARPVDKPKRASPNKQMDRRSARKTRSEDSDPSEVMEDDSNNIQSRYSNLIVNANDEGRKGRYKPSESRRTSAARHKQGRHKATKGLNDPDAIDENDEPKGHAAHDAMHEMDASAQSATEKRSAGHKTSRSHTGNGRYPPRVPSTGDRPRRASVSIPVRVASEGRPGVCSDQTLSRLKAAFNGDIEQSINDAPTPLAATGSAKLDATAAGPNCRQKGSTSGDRLAKPVVRAAKPRRFRARPALTAASKNVHRKSSSSNGGEHSSKELEPATEFESVIVSKDDLKALVRGVTRQAKGAKTAEEIEAIVNVALQGEDDEVSFTEPEEEDEDEFEDDAQFLFFQGSFCYRSCGGYDVSIDGEYEEEDEEAERHEQCTSPEQEGFETDEDEVRRKEFGKDDGQGENEAIPKKTERKNYTGVISLALKKIEEPRQFVVEPKASQKESSKSGGDWCTAQHRKSSVISKLEQSARFKGDRQNLRSEGANISMEYARVFIKLEAAKQNSHASSSDIEMLQNKLSLLKQQMELAGSGKLGVTAM